MLKNLLFITFILSSNALYSAEPLYGDFEAELRALETNQLKVEELQMNQADAVTDVITDEVPTAQAATVRNSAEKDPEVKPESTENLKEKTATDSSKARRIRSR